MKDPTVWLLAVIIVATIVLGFVSFHSPNIASSGKPATQLHFAGGKRVATSSAIGPDATTDPISVAGYGPTTLALSWQQSGDLCFTDYRIQDATYSNNGPWTTISTITSSSVTAEYWDGFSPGQTYWFQDIDDSGCGGGSATSNVVQVTFPAYASLSYSDVGSSSVLLSWNNNAHYGGLLGFASYQVQEQINGGGFSTVDTITSSSSATSYTVAGVTGLNTGTVYDFKVLTTDECNNCQGGSYPTTSTSNTVTHLTINQPVASPASVELGQTIQFSVSVTGGRTPYSYSWSGLPAGCSSSNVNPLTCTPSSAGTASVTVTVTDSLGITLTSLSVSTTVVPSLSVAQPTASATSVQTGQTVVFTVSVTGGTAPYSYSWNGLPAGCSSSDTSQLSCVPTTMGSWSVTVTVTDSSGIDRTSAPVTVSATSSSGGSGSGSGASGGAISTDEWIAIGAVVRVAIIVAVVLLAVRGRKPKTPQDSSSASGTPPTQWQPPSGGSPPTGGNPQ